MRTYQQQKNKCLVAQFSLSKSQLANPKPCLLPYNVTCETGSLDNVIQEIPRLSDHGSWAII